VSSNERIYPFEAVVTAGRKVLPETIKPVLVTNSLAIFHVCYKYQNILSNAFSCHPEVGVSNTMTVLLPL
jgi:hypothetical protein